MQVARLHVLKGTYVLKDKAELRKKYRRTDLFHRLGRRQRTGSEEGPHDIIGGERLRRGFVAA